jgi:hypothetical protein
LNEDSLSVERLHLLDGKRELQFGKGGVSREQVPNSLEVLGIWASPGAHVWNPIYTPNIVEPEGVEVAKDC